MACHYYLLTFLFVLQNGFRRAFSTAEGILARGGGKEPTSRRAGSWVARAKLSLALIACSLIGSSTVGAQTKQETIDFGTLQLHLGEARSEVLEGVAVAGYRTLSVQNNKNTYILQWQRKPNEWKTIGNISFSADRLRYISKDWSPAGTSDYDFGKAIYLAAKSLHALDCRQVLLNAITDDQPGGLIRSVRLSCDRTNRRLEITVLDTDSGTNVGKTSAVLLDEILENPN